MVVSLEFLFNELETKVRNYHQASEKIDDVAERLCETAAKVDNQIDYDISYLIDACQKRRAVLKETLWQIVEKEHKALLSKRDQVDKGIKDLVQIRKEAVQTGSSFRILYENMLEQHQSLNLEMDEYLGVSLKAGRQQMLDTILQFGTLCLEVHKKKEKTSIPCNFDDDQISGCLSSAESFDVLPSTEDAMPGMYEGSSNAESVMYGKGEAVCKFSCCCNCVNVCEEHKKPLSMVQGRSKVNDWEAWLLKPKSPEGFHDEKLCVDEAYESGTMSNKLIDQLESLNLVEEEESKSFKRQEKFSAQFIKDLQVWLVSKQKRSLPHAEKQETGMKTEVQDSHVSKVWEAIIAVPPSSWLRSNHMPDLKQKNAEQVASNVSQYEEIKNSPFFGWLKAQKPEGHNAGISHAQVHQSKDQSKDEVSVLSNWLKRKHTEEDIEEEETETTKAFKRIKNIPLTYWLKSQSPGNHMPDMRSFKKGKSSSKATKRFEDISEGLLEKWLKGKTCTVEKQAFTKEWLVSPKQEQQAGYQHSKKASFLDQFEEISKSNPSIWIKREKKLPEWSKHDLCKWLSDGSLSGCKRCGSDCIEKMNF